MITLRFHRDLYDGRAVDAALGVFADHARCERREEPTHWVVDVHAEADERLVARELANYALGLTIRGLPGSSNDGAGQPEGAHR